MNKNKARLKYLSRTRRYLPCSGAVKNQIMEQITENVDGYLAEEPEARYVQIVGRFGKPEAVAAAYVENMDTAEILRAMQIRQRIVAIVAGAMAALLLICAVGIAALFIHVNRDFGGTDTITIRDGKCLPVDDPYWTSPEGLLVDESGG